MNRTILKATIYDAADEAVEVLGSYTPARRGARDAFGVPLEPDDVETIEILDAADHYGNTRYLSEDERASAFEALWTAAADAA